ncbi:MULTISPECIES: phosphoribosyltransferase [unclassified Streptomyces]|uniref:phosphoribosyltransferase n=1 Tax=unclassified Streptomyces TaxID=2593676 RepID=UPI001BE7FBE6|nr:MULTISPECIES: phosphoribosyltransferase family protein [unclassified Streptomyces]MBT2407592.1 phosphoribosyltransferase [Streptomyces sp. ISL-21]MBT2459099.1 phosphoribosyltransferase [Streptomyces sp. ISL-86]MBT2611586.1 phosphoribosyltransferase [Streptomyces sp. ISL-87]
MVTRFENRRQAGRRLAERLDESIGARQAADVVVLALPRGGVPVAAEVARALEAPLDVVVARKIGAPGQPEVGIGAIAGEDPPLFDPRALQILDVTETDLAPTVARERAELHRRELLYRRGRPAPRLEGKTVVLVDDGLATGVTARAALRRLRAENPARLILAVPVCAPESAVELRREADDLICLEQPPLFHAVGLWYDDFDQVSDQEVIDLLEEQRAVH